MSFDRKRNIYCGNCGKKGHTYRYCREPVISIGILLLYDQEIPPQSSTNSYSYSHTLPQSVSTNSASSNPIDIPVSRKKSRKQDDTLLGYSPSPPSSFFVDHLESHSPLDQQSSHLTTTTSTSTSTAAAAATTTTTATATTTTTTTTTTTITTTTAITTTTTTPHH